MRRLFRSVLLLLGLLMFVVGTTGAVLAGPDDTVALVSHEVGSEGIPVVTAPALTAFTDVDLVVTASATGEVFVGSAHRVDVRDLVAGVEYFEVTQALPTFAGGIDGSVREGGEFMHRSTRDVTDLDVWRQQAAGEGEQQIVLPLDGEPVGVLVLPDASSTPVVGVAVRVAGLFLASLLLAGGGAGLLVVRWLLGRRQTPSGGSTAVEQATDERPSPSDADRPHAPALRTVAALSVGALALSGCAVPSTVAQDEPQKVALSADSLDDLVSAHDERRVRAVKAARFPKSDSTRWRGAFAGPLLEAAQYATASDGAYKKRSGRPDPVTAGAQVWSPTFGSYPMWALAEVDGLERPRPAHWDSGQDRDAKKKKKKKEKEKTSLTVFTRAGAAEHWQAFAAIPVPKGSLPAPVDTAFSPTPDAATLERAEAAADLVEKWWRTGKKKGIAINAESRKVRQNITTYWFEGKEYPRQLELSTWGEKDERLRIVEVEGGHLVVQTSRLKVTDLSPPGMTLHWVEPLRTLQGQSERGPHTRGVMTGVIHLPADGKPRLLSSDLANVLG